MDKSDPTLKVFDAVRVYAVEANKEETATPLERSIGEVPSFMRKLLNRSKKKYTTTTATNFRVYISTANYWPTIKGCLFSKKVNCKCTCYSLFRE